MTTTTADACRCGGAGWLTLLWSRAIESCRECNPFGAKDYPGDYSCQRCQGTGSEGEPDGPVCPRCRGMCA